MRGCSDAQLKFNYRIYNEPYSLTLRMQQMATASSEWVIQLSATSGAQPVTLASTQEMETGRL